MRKQIKEILILEKLANSPWVEKVVSRFQVPTHTVADQQAVYERIQRETDPIAAAKKILFLTENNGAFFRKCPGTKEYICCDYKILHIGTFCTMDCSYCILQSYFHPPILQLFLNIDDMLAELDAVLGQENTYRIGTGEYTDSLIWDEYLDLSRILVDRFARQHHSILELKTKTINVDGLQGLRHNRKTILAWSVNTPAIIKSQERSTASLSARLQAAATCCRWGYPVAFHFDPLVIYEGCEKEYDQVIRHIFAAVSPRDVVWISLGSFRFMPSLKPIIQNRFSRSKIVYGEFIPGMDGKMRYFKPLRKKLYRSIMASIREVAPDVLVYFCMEDSDVWQSVMGFAPEEEGGLGRMLDESAKKHCELSSNCNPSKASA